MIAAMIPTAEAMRAHNKEIAAKRMGPVWMEENHETDWVNAFFGSWENKHNPPELELHHPSEEESYLDHGYDEEKGLAGLNAEDLQKAAEFRGGSYEGESLEDIYTPVPWKCAFGYQKSLQKEHWVLLMENMKFQMI